MKTVLALVLFSASFASAVSMKPYDKWNCYFAQINSGMLRGTYVNVNFNMLKNEGSAVMIADCINCRIMPLEVSVTRNWNQNTLYYTNAKKGFDLRIFWSPLAHSNTPLNASFNGRSGSCTAVN